MNRARNLMLVKLLFNVLLSVVSLHLYCSTRLYTPTVSLSVNSTRTRAVEESPTVFKIKISGTVEHIH